MRCRHRGTIRGGMRDMLSPGDTRTRSCRVSDGRNATRPADRIGGGFAGLALASRCARALGDAVQGHRRRSGARHGRCADDARASAIAAAARRLFETHRRLGRGRRRGAADPRHGGDRQARRTRCGRSFLTFAARSSRASRSPTWSRTADLVAALSPSAPSAEASMLRADGGARLRRRGDGVDGDASATARVVGRALVVAADGARSAIREPPASRRFGWDYRAVRHRHDGRA